MIIRREQPGAPFLARLLREKWGFCDGGCPILPGAPSRALFAREVGIFRRGGAPSLRSLQGWARCCRREFLMPRHKPPLCRARSTRPLQSAQRTGHPPRWKYREDQEGWATRQLRVRNCLRYAQCRNHNGEDYTDPPSANAIVAIAAVLISCESKNSRDG